tara:strand:- start:2401 stop:2622 length:222 start_codon:yes stop_codon:yes gene_type:complete
MLKTGDLTENQLENLKDLYVERMVDGMDLKALIQYVSDDLYNYVNELPEAEFIDEAYSYWDEYFDEIIEEIKE